MVELKRGQHLYIQGRSSTATHVFRLQSGVLEQSSQQPGSEAPVILRWIGKEASAYESDKNDVFVGLEEAEELARQTSVICLTTVHGEWLTHRDYMRRRHNSDDLSQFKTDRLVEQKNLLNAVIRRLAIQKTSSNAEEAVANLLIEMALWKKPSLDDRVVLLGDAASSIRVSSLAKSAGLTIRWWGEYIKKFHHSGIIYNGDRVIIADLWRLRLIAQGYIDNQILKTEEIKGAVTSELNAGNAFLARNIALQALEKLSDLKPVQKLSIQFLASLACARAGSVDEARRLFNEFRLTDQLPANPTPDQLVLHAEWDRQRAEWDSLDARLLKDHAFEKGIDPTERDQRLRDAYQAYRTVFDLNRTYFSGINAAALAFCIHERESMEQILSEIRKSGSVYDDDYWAVATRGEMELLCGNSESAAEHFRIANSICNSPGQKASTRRQLLRLRGFLEKADVDLCLAQLRQPAPIVYSGHMPATEANPIRALGLSGDESDPYFQARQAIQQTIAGYGQACAYGALAAGADLMVAESIIEAKQELHVVLPMDFETFKQKSVSGKDRHSGWTSAFNKCLTHARTIRIFQDCRELERDKHLADQSVVDSLFHGGFRFAAGLALLHADELGVTQARMLAISADGAPTSLAGTGEAERVARSLGIPVDRIPCNWRKPGSPVSVASSRLRPVVFFFPAHDSAEAVNKVREALCLALDTNKILTLPRKHGTPASLALCCDDVPDALVMVQKSREIRREHQVAVQCDFGLAVGADREPSGALVKVLYGGQFLPFDLPRAGKKSKRTAAPNDFLHVVFATEPFAAEARLVLQEPDILQPLGRFNSIGRKSDLKALPSLRSFAVTDYALTTDWRTKP